MCIRDRAFAALAVVESTYAIAGNDPVIMAPQQLVDCVPGFAGQGDKSGCTANHPTYAYAFMAVVKTMREADYPYV